LLCVHSVPGDLTRFFITNFGLDILDARLNLALTEVPVKEQATAGAVNLFEYDSRESGAWLSVPRSNERIEMVELAPEGSRGSSLDHLVERGFGGHSKVAEPAVGEGLPQCLRTRLCAEGDTAWMAQGVGRTERSGRRVVHGRKRTAVFIWLRGGERFH